MHQEEAEDEYNPESPVYYKYEAKNILTDSYSKPLNRYKKINIFAYEVRNNGTTPFMQVLLTKSVACEMLTLPFTPVLVSIGSKEELIDYVKVCLFGIINDDDFEVFDSLVLFDGFYEMPSTSDLYLFFDITKRKLNLDDIFYHSSLRFGIIDELANIGKVCNIPVSKNIYDLLWSEDCQMMFLSDINGKKYDIPVVAYTSKPNSRLNYHYIFGEPKSEGMFGTSYYFKDFYKSFEEACEIEGMSGIVRYALHLGFSHYVENSLNDSNDNSEIKQQKLRENPHFEALTMRITDYDACWSVMGDSIHLGQVELDNGEVLNKQITAVKEYEQQIPLSFHYVNKATLGEDLQDYSIL